VRFIPALILTLILMPLPVAAQDVRYVSDKIFIVLHRGPGTDYKWVARLTPGTRLKVVKTSGDWSEVTTSRGTKGWVRSEYLSASAPAQVLLPNAEKLAAELSESNTALKAELATLREQKDSIEAQLSATSGELENVSGSFNDLKQVSGKAVQLDVDNRRLVEEAENLRSKAEMLEGENQRLQDKLQSEDFLNGALAVCLGVILTLVVPRLIPKRRRNSEWA
jgi:SH3 domain protein